MVEPRDIAGGVDCLANLTFRLVEFVFLLLDGLNDFYGVKVGVHNCDAYLNAINEIPMFLMWSRVTSYQF